MTLDQRLGINVGSYYSSTVSVGGGDSRDVSVFINPQDLNGNKIFLDAQMLLLFLLFLAALH